MEELSVGTDVTGEIVCLKVGGALMLSIESTRKYCQYPSSSWRKSLFLNAG